MKEAITTERNNFKHIQEWIDLRGKGIEALTMGEVLELKKLIEDSQTHLGPYIYKLADDFLMKVRLQAEARARGNKTVQEKIAYVKMEYFLYGFTEAFRMIKEIRQLSAYIKRLDEETLAAEQTKAGIRAGVMDRDHNNDETYYSRSDARNPER